MEKISCEVVCDLLPLYCDGIASQDSRALVEEHLRDCKACAGVLEKMKKEYRFSEAGEPEREAVVKDMASAWERSVKRSFSKGVLLAGLICALLFGAYWSLTRLILVDVPGVEIEAAVTEVTDERVKLSFTVTNGNRVSRSYTEVTEDGKCYVIFRQALLAEGNGGGENWTGAYELSRIRTLESGEPVRVKEIYCGGEKDGVLVWREE